MSHRVGEARIVGTDAVAYESITVAATSIGLTVGTVGANTQGLITVETAQLRFRLDGTAPTATEGHVLDPGDILHLSTSADLLSFRAIRTGATSAMLRCTYGV